MHMILITSPEIWRCVGPDIAAGARYVAYDQRVLVHTFDLGSGVYAAS